jgi:hypothetical protein
MKTMCYWLHKRESNRIIFYNVVRLKSTVISLYNNDYILNIVNSEYMKARKIIAVSLENYDKIKRYGLAGDSFNIAVSRLIKLADKSAGSVVG